MPFPIHRAHLITGLRGTPRAGQETTNGSAAKKTRDAIELLRRAASSLRRVTRASSFMRCGLGERRPRLVDRGYWVGVIFWRIWKELTRREKSFVDTRH